MCFYKGKVYLLFVFHNHFPYFALIKSHTSSSYSIPYYFTCPFNINVKSLVSNPLNNKTRPKNERNIDSFIPVYKMPKL